MKRTVFTLLLISIALLNARADSWIRINQLGYLPGSVKVAVFISQQPEAGSAFSVCDALTGKVVYKGTA